TSCRRSTVAACSIRESPSTRSSWFGTGSSRRDFVAKPAALLKRSLIFVHRWLGVALSVIFMLWFVSGIVMMYWTFPGVSARDRLQRAIRLEPSQVRISPEDAASAAGLDTSPAAIRLTSFDGRPAYRIGEGGG